MTTIAGKITNGRVKLAWDSQSTAGSRATFGINKVMKINNQFAVGVSGLLRYANLIHRAEINRIHPADLADPGFDGYGWLLDTAIPSWMKSAKKEIENSPDSDAEAPWGFVLVALPGQLFTVGHDFAVQPVEEFTAIGSGSEYAITAMHLGKNPKQAVEVASHLDLFTGGAVKEMTV